MSTKIEGVRDAAARDDAAPAGRAPRSSRHSSSYARVGRTIGEARERLETANERAAARKKDKRKKRTRIGVVSLFFLILAGVLAFCYFAFFSHIKPTTNDDVKQDDISFAPTIEVVDADAGATGGKLTSRMREYIGMLEADFRALGYTPVRAILPTGSIREVDFYLDGHSGFIKTIIDRGSAVSAEDADRMLRYLTDQGITDFEYIDVRIDGKAYWK